MDREEVWKVVLATSRLFPDLRIGQLISNAASMVEWSSTDVFYLPDDRLVQGLRKLQQKFGGSK